MLNIYTSYILGAGDIARLDGRVSFAQAAV